MREKSKGVRTVQAIMRKQVFCGEVLESNGRGGIFIRKYTVVRFDFQLSWVFFYQYDVNCSSYWREGKITFLIKEVKASHCICLLAQRRL